jgi:hypothetical protein
LRRAVATDPGRGATDSAAAEVSALRRTAARKREIIGAGRAGDDEAADEVLAPRAAAVAAAVAARSVAGEELDRGCAADAGTAGAVLPGLAVRPVPRAPGAMPFPGAFPGGGPLRGGGVAVVAEAVLRRAGAVRRALSCAISIGPAARVASMRRTLATSACRPATIPPGV